MLEIGFHLSLVFFSFHFFPQPHPTLSFLKIEKFPSINVLLFFKRLCHFRIKFRVRTKKRLIIIIICFNIYLLQFKLRHFFFAVVLLLVRCLIMFYNFFKTIFQLKFYSKNNTAH